MENYDALFTPMTINKTTIKNRIVMCPMGGTELIQEGKFNQRAAEFYLARARGGVGLIIPGIALITDMWGRGGWLHEQMEFNRNELTRFLHQLHAYDCKMFMQLGAGMGRVLAINSGMLPADFDKVRALNAPSEGLPNVWVPEEKHREMTVAEIQSIILSFCHSAKIARECGMDGVEIHAIHEGYLLDQFSISATNHRQDQYGGCLENRLRFTTEIIAGIKSACGDDFPVSVRYSVTSKMKGFNSGALPGENYQEFGRSLEESPAVARLLEQGGCDMLNADNGSYDAWFWAHPPMYMPMACNLPEAAYIKKFVSIPVVCAGRMEDVTISAPAVANHDIDAVGIARQLLADPEWANKIKTGKLADIRPCIACHNGCFGRLFAGKGTSCAVNPAAMNEEKYQITPAVIRKEIVVIGGGIGGMEAARICTLRGHKVRLYEKTARLGGVFIAATLPDFKEADRKLLRWYLKEIRDLNIEVHLNSEITPRMLPSLTAQEVIIATGAKPRYLPGIDINRHKIWEAIDFLEQGGDVAPGNAVVIGGGVTGCEIAYDLARKGHNVALVEMVDDILRVPDLCAANSAMLRTLLDHYHVAVYTSARISDVTPSGVIIMQGGETHVLLADIIITSIGYNSDKTLAIRAGDDPHVHVIGDAAQVGNVLGAIWDANDTALALSLTE